MCSTFVGSLKVLGLSVAGCALSIDQIETSSGLRLLTFEEVREDEESDEA
jgi:hypothetical protein